MGNSQQIDTRFYGFRIYEILKNGPLDKTNKFKELEDFIVPPGGWEREKSDFSKYLSSRKNIPTELNVYSIRTRSFRSIIIVPDDTWCESNKKGCLGANVRYENWAIAHKNVLRIVDIKPFSELSKLDVVQHDDFIVAIRKKDCEIISLNQEEKDPLSYFSDIISALIGNNVELILYNVNNGFKSVEISLNKKENGQILGCDLAYGQLHEFPQVITYLNINIDDNSSSDKKKLNNNNINCSKDNEQVNLNDDKSSLINVGEKNNV